MTAAVGVSPANALDLNGKVFGSWTVLEKAPPDLVRLLANNYNSYWTCQCACGRVQDVQGSALATGRSVRCRPCGAVAGAHTRRERRRGQTD